MRKFLTLLAFILIVFAIQYRFDHLTPDPDNYKPPFEFTPENAMRHITAIASKPHYTGSDEHLNVQTYLMRELEAMGLEPQQQQGYTSGNWGNVSKAVNIMARIPGTKSGKALVLMSHYDSNPHSAPGASDAASGVATVMEGVRAYLESGGTHRNDLILLFTDAEELGLNGARLFVQEHPWANDVGLILNFEARGSGGPSYMLIETNNGNKALIEQFSVAQPSHPVANSLAYSIYKLLPNDTDLTVFREDANIQGFNFAFIDDHFDYHTALDRPDRLNSETLLHQASYLMPLLEHFGNTDLEILENSQDLVYFDFPGFGLVYYPFYWILPMVALAALLIIFLIVYGLKRKSLSALQMLKGFLPVLIALAFSGLLGYSIWPLLIELYPHYQDILHGFTYNGHLYIQAVVALALGIAFLVFKKYDRISLSNLLVAPAIIWWIICLLAAIYLKGASFVILPLFSLLTALFISIRQKEPHPILLFILALPALWILSPFTVMFPVGLGLKILVSTALLTVLTFMLTLPILYELKSGKTLGIISLLLGGWFLIQAHRSNGNSITTPRPNSLVYLLNADTREAIWATYNKTSDPWIETFIRKGQSTAGSTPFSSKYNTRFSRTTDAPLVNIPPPRTQVLLDTIKNGKRYLTLCIIPQRKADRLEVRAYGATIMNATVNGAPLSKRYLEHRTERLFTHFLTQNDVTTIHLEVMPGRPLTLDLFECAHDLINHPLLKVPSRSDDQIPMPFVINDATIIQKKWTL